MSATRRGGGGRGGAKDRQLSNRTNEATRHLKSAYLAAVYSSCHRKIEQVSVFSFHQNSLGGRVRFLISGSAPLRDDVMVFLRCALGCQVMWSTFRGCF